MPYPPQITDLLPTATIEHIVTDQGNGGAFCSACWTKLTEDPFKIPTTCPKCKSRLIDTGNVFINQGGVGW